ncbi:interleukin-12 receptor subunit beta-2 [Pyxicephalus adspersus]|uniref:interleukin-12 receptor subunit beta-2 n=1 Tax=Pyxicephalus adspersus TaxID=30357 RepID=UPI003B59AC55
MDRRVLICWAAFNIILLCHLNTIYSEACPAAKMKVRPSNITLVGSMVTITCTRNSNRIQEVTLITPNAKKTHQHSVTITDTSLTPGRRRYLCKDKEVLLCGEYVDFGLPPDQPKKISCKQEGEFGNISCSWVLERNSGISDRCTLQLQTRQNKVMEHVLNNCRTGTNLLTLPMTVNRGREYTVLVISSNVLGTNTSKFFNFTFYDIVKPHPPTNLTINCHQTVDECFVNVHPDGDIQLTRLRYRVSNERDWQKAENSINGSFTLNHLHPVTTYDFQAAYKYRYDQGQWSDWSQLVTWETPEGRPRGKLDVWYKLSSIPDNKWTITLYWKSMNASEVRGHSWFYQVTTKRLSQVSINYTADTWFSKDIEADEYDIDVSVHNSKGNSTPTHRKVTRQELSAEGLPPPSNVIATTNGSSNSITLSWDLPAEYEDLGWDQIVEWEDPTEDKISRTNWVKVPKFERTVTLSEHYKPYICYQFRVYFLKDGRAGVPGMTRASTQEKAPETALDIKIHKKVSSVLVTWRGIPPQKQMGCILHYNIYLTDLRTSVTKKDKLLYNPSQTYQYAIDTRDMNGKYMLGMTYSNGAGETTTRQEVYFTVDGSQDEYVIVYMIIPILVSALLLFFIVIAKQQFLLKILPKIRMKAVPDPANCEWAKECISDKDKIKSFPSCASSTSDCDEAETLEIEVLSSEEEFHYCPTYTINPLQIVSPQEKDSCFQEDAEILQPSLQQAEHSPYRSIDFKLTEGIKVQTSDYLVNHVITMDYLPKNILTEYKDKSEEELFHPQFLLPSWVMPSQTIKLDTVKIDFS